MRLLLGLASWTIGMGCLVEKFSDVTITSWTCSHFCIGLLLGIGIVLIYSYFDNMFKRY